VKIALNRLRPLFGAGLFSFLAPALGQDFSIMTISLDADSRPQLEFESETNSYYVLYRGYSVTNLTPIVLKLGADANGALVDPVPFQSQSLTRFFRLREIALAAPVDTDGDGIDDLYEVARSGILSPLNMADGEEDPDADDLTNVEEYGFGTNPSAADSDGDGWIDGIERGDGTNPLSPASRPHHSLLARPAMLLELPGPDGEGASGTALLLARPPLLIDAPSAEASGTAVAGVFLAQPPVSIDLPSADAAGVTGGAHFLANPPVLMDVPSADGAGAGGARPFLANPPLSIRLNSQ
jgi:hypothetical protein